MAFVENRRQSFSTSLNRLQKCEYGLRVPSGGPAGTFPTLAWHLPQQLRGLAGVRSLGDVFRHLLGDNRKHGCYSLNETLCRRHGTSDFRLETQPMRLCQAARGIRTSQTDRLSRW